MADNTSMWNIVAIRNQDGILVECTIEPLDDGIYKVEFSATTDPEVLINSSYAEVRKPSST